MTTLVRWDPVRELASMQSELSRFMNGLLEGNGRTAQSWVPTLDVWETADELVYAFDLPGVPQEKISVEVEDGALTVTATRERTEQAEGDRYYRFERRHGEFSRTVGLPQGTDDGDVKASYTDGVLEVRVRKPQESTPKRVEIAVGRETGPATIEGSAEKA
jgi:HSP20 family protein